MKKLRFLLLSLLVAILLVILGGCSAPERTLSLDEKAQDVYRSLMCPLCPGQTIDQSQSELSAQMRAVVREKLEQGETKEQILQFFVERYGEGVLAAPAKSGFSLIAWLAPITGIVVGGIILVFVIRKWARREHESSSEPTAPTQEVASDEKYRKQLEKELKDFGEGGFR
ncbi:MAG: cytochrome c-type biogenesis protein CcmH [Chloroflexi bacterium]|nr:cytochrome c-type biogenesis protein CcmH [Chloroflexota bacterium]